MTTYALLPRDADRLLPVEWHIAVLDEAQAIKNVRGEDDAAGVPPRRPPPAVPHRHADGEPSRRAVVAIRLSDAGTARRCQTLCPRVPHPDREEAGRRTPRRAVGPAEALPVAADQEPGGGRPAAEDRNPAPARTCRPAARSLRDRARRDARESAPRGRRARARPQPHRRARRAAQAAPGVLRSAPGQADRGASGERQRQARAADGDAPALDRGRPADPVVFAIHQHARPDQAGSWSKPASILSSCAATRTTARARSHSSRRARCRCS